MTTVCDGRMFEWPSGRGDGPLVERMRHLMDRNPYAPIPGKCIWWREFPIDEDKWDSRIKESEKGISCSCFVEGKGWKFTKSELPPECPDARACRYYIKNV